jgi:small Trp-rich protein
LTRRDLRDASHAASSLASAARAAAAKRRYGRLKATYLLVGSVGPHGYSRSRSNPWVTAMWMLWVAVVALLLWYFDIGFMGQISGWWIALLFGIAFVWFEVFEKRLGLDKKAAFDELDKAKKERIKRQMEQARNFRSRRM